MIITLWALIHTRTTINYSLLYFSIVILKVILGKAHLLCLQGEKTHHLIKLFLLSVVHCWSPYQFSHAVMHILTNGKGTVHHIFPIPSYPRGIVNSSFFLSHLSSDLQIGQLARMSSYFYWKPLLICIFDYTYRYKVCVCVCIQLSHRSI